MTIHVKICGVTTPEQALACAEAGASAIGVNFISSSPRCVDVVTARAIARALGSRALLVGVVANLSVDQMCELRLAADLGCLQLSGDEAPESLLPLLPHAYKALRIALPSDVARAESFGGDHILVDAKVEGSLGGTGKTFDWRLVVGLAQRRKLTLAGGLSPENVASAVRAVRPFAVDVASGVESGTPGTKDMARVRAFIAAARSA